MKIERKSLLDATLEALRRAIVQGDLPPASRLTEERLAGELDSGRSTVRAALLELEQEGLVQRTRYSAWAVAALTPKAIWEIYSFRGALEGLAARIVARTLDEAKRRALVMAHEQLEAAQAGDESRRLEADLAFHRTVVELAGHALLARQYAVLLHKIEWVWRWSDRLSPGRIELSPWHRPALEALLSGDPDRAEAAMRALTEASLADDLADLAGLQQQRA